MILSVKGTSEVHPIPPQKFEGRWCRHTEAHASEVHPLPPQKRLCLQKSV